MPAAGNLRDRATFERLIPGDDGYGNAVAAWGHLMTVWVDMLESPGREAVAAGRVEAARSATLRLRRSAASLDLTEADRVRVRGRTWNIRSIGDVGRDRAMLELVIEVGVAT